LTAPPATLFGLPPNLSGSAPCCTVGDPLYYESLPKSAVSKSAVNVEGGIVFIDLYELYNETGIHGDVGYLLDLPPPPPAHHQLSYLSLLLRVILL